MVSKSMEYIRELTKKSPKMELRSDTDFAKYRKINDEQCAQMPLDKGVTSSLGKINGVSVEEFVPDTLRGDTVVMHLHGGAFVFGSLVTCRGYASTICGESGLRVVTVDYRLAPEYPFPAGVNDCFAVYKGLSEKYPQANIALVGESAGATLVLAVTLMAKDAGIKLPSCVCSYAPCVTFADNLESREKNLSTDIIIGENIVPKMRELYVCSSDPKNPYASVYYGNYTGFPPLKLVADTGELFADDTRILEEKARAAGVNVECEMFEGTFHTFPAVGRATEESARVLRETSEFIHRYSDRL